MLGDGHGVLAVQFAIHGHVDLFGKDAQLLDGGGAVDVAGHQQRTAVLLALQHAGQLAREGGLTRTLQTRHQDDGGLAGEVDFGGLASHQFGQLVVDNLHHQLAGLDGGQHVLSQGFLLDGIGEVLGYLVVDVGIEQGFAHVFQGFGHVDFGYLAFSLEDFEGSL